MDKIRIAHIVGQLEPVGYSRTALDILGRADPSKYKFLLITGRWFRKMNPEVAVETVILPELSKPITFMSGLRIILKLCRLLNEWKPDILHVHSLKSGLVGTLAGRLSRVPSLVYTSYKLNLPKSFRRRRRRFDIVLFDTAWFVAKIPAMLANTIVTVTPHGLEDELAMRLAPRSKYRVIYNAIRPERIESTRHDNAEVLKYKMGLESCYPLLGTATRLDREKGLEFLLEAVFHLKNMFPDITLLLIGDGPSRENLIVLAKRLGLGSHIRFLGLRDDVPSLLRAMDIFVLPSLYEAAGIALAEAMAFGKPVVATRVGGLSEIIRDGEDGFLVPPGDAMRLAEKIARIARDRELAKRMGERAADKAHKLFDMNKMVNDYEGLYQMLLKR